MKLSPLILALALPVLLSCANDDVTSVHTAAMPQLAVGQNLPLVYDVENTAANYPAPFFPSFGQLPSNLILPDPFRLFNGNVDVSFGGWERHRAEFLASIENYEIGPKPPRSDLDETATFANDTLTVVVTRKSNGQSATFTSPIYLPEGTGPFPAMIGMTWSFFCSFIPCLGTGSLPVGIFTSRNIATIPYMHDQATTYLDFSGQGHANDPFYRLYPEYTVGDGNSGQYAAWSWGVSRLIDGIEIAAANGSLPIDVHHLGVTGCSYAGKMALFAGAMDERVALTIAQESGGGGAPAWRVSQAIEPDGSVEKIDNTNYTWFADQMRQFSADNVYKLPHDHHELMALVAPRGLLVTGNTDFYWLSNHSNYVSSNAAEETYKQLGIPDRFGYYIDGGHNHCAVPDAEVPVIEAFVDKFLLGQNVDTNIGIYPNTDDFTSINYQGWMPWALRNDIAALVADGTLKPGEASGLSAKLEAALSSIAEGRTTPAMGQLNAFSNQVNAFVNSHRLTPEQAAVLTDKINSTKTRIGG